ncbi:MAG TPA: hypothetical protein DEH78_18195, partial [Solibacterales bacterium]|nr:hypothetical protein [Bryobacterales bacterium]
TAFGEELRDVLGEGDLIGVERFTNEREWRHAARTATDVILYGIPADLFASLAARCPAVQRFVSAHVTAGGGGG